MALTKDDKQFIVGTITNAIKENNKLIFGEMDKRFERIDERFEEMDKRFEEIDKRFERIDERFEKIDKRFEKMEGNIDKRFSEFKIWISQNFLTKDEAASKKDLGGLETRLNRKISAVQDAVVTIDSKFTEITAIHSAEIHDVKLKIGMN